MPEIFIETREDLLVCNGSGYPVPRLIWYIDGKHIKENKNEETSLTIKRCSGNYNCSASNVFGTTSSTVHLPTAPAGK